MKRLTPLFLFLLFLTGSCLSAEDRTYDPQKAMHVLGNSKGILISPNDPEIDTFRYCVYTPTGMTEIWGIAEDCQKKSCAHSLSSGMKLIQLDWEVRGKAYQSIFLCWKLPGMTFVQSPGRLSRWLHRQVCEKRQETK